MAWLCNKYVIDLIIFTSLSVTQHFGRTTFKHIVNE
uniref:Uncharacterized protein n=1 Tax=Arundo donax TaxID=35708 RepID=A0A0A9D7M8_ARUDO